MRACLYSVYSVRRKEGRKEEKKEEMKKEETQPKRAKNRLFEIRHYTNIAKI